MAVTRSSMDACRLSDILPQSAERGFGWQQPEELPTPCTSGWSRYSLQSVCDPPDLLAAPRMPAVESWLRFMDLSMRPSGEPHPQDRVSLDDLLRPPLFEASADAVPSAGIDGPLFDAAHLQLDRGSIPPVEVPQSPVDPFPTKARGSRQPVRSAALAIGALLACAIAPSSSVSPPPKASAHIGSLELASVAASEPVLDQCSPSIVEATLPLAESANDSSTDAVASVQSTSVDETPIPEAKPTLSQRPVQPVIAPVRQARAPADETLEPFDAPAARQALDALVGLAVACVQDERPASSVRVSVTFAPTGAATLSTVDGPVFSGTAAGGCIARTFRIARVRPFSGGPVTVHKTYTLY